MSWWRFLLAVTAACMTCVAIVVPTTASAEIPSDPSPSEAAVEPQADWCVIPQKRYGAGLYFCGVRKPGQQSRTALGNRSGVQAMAQYTGQGRYNITVELVRSNNTVIRSLTGSWKSGIAVSPGGSYYARAVCRNSGTETNALGCDSW